MVGAIEAGIAGGLESMSMVPMGGNKAVFNPAVVAERPELYISMGLTAENVARASSLARRPGRLRLWPRTAKAIAAITAGKFTGEIVPVTTAEGGTFAVDEGPRADTTLDALAKLRPVFHARAASPPATPRR
jgi:acetyl-CoA acyltransferase